MNGRIPNFLRFITANDLVRIGKNNDGGYLVSQADLDKTDVLIGLGIYDDWSFESDFVNLKNIEVFAYDASISQNYFLKLLIKSVFRIYNPKQFFYWLKVNLRYRSFFSKKSNHHIPKFVGLNTISEIHCTLESVLNSLDSNNIFLKIDVEGSEYRFLNTLIEYKNRITGLVIEFHDCDLHLTKIKKFVDEFDLNLVHIHANNFAPLRLDDQLPLVLELTFSKNAKLGGRVELPHLLDMPNNKFEDEINLILDN